LRIHCEQRGALILKLFLGLFLPHDALMPRQTAALPDRSWVEIDRAALRHNLKAVRKFSGNAGIMAVVKANGYGHGLTEVAAVMRHSVEIFAVASLATFALLRERALPQAPGGGAGPAASSGVGAALAQLGRTWRQARRYRDFTALLACAVAYQAGISVVVALAAIYAEQALGFKQTDTMMLIFLVNIAAAAGAFAWGYVQDRIGHQRAIAVTLVGWVVMTVLAGLATSAALFWGAAVIAGLCMGSSQSAGRALAGALAPERQRAEFFGLWTFAIRLSAIIGPVTYGLITLLSAGNHRLAIFSTGLFFVLGLVLLRAVDVRRGIAVAQEADARVDERADEQDRPTVG
jgi:UMF1 family MFS transporter